MDASDTPVNVGPEEVIWSGTPSQIVNLKAFLIGGLILAALIAAWVGVLWAEWVRNQLHWVFALPVAMIVLWLAYKWIVVRTTRYELTTQRLRMRSGILAKSTDDLELYRVRDWTIREPLHYRLFKLGTLTLITSDQTTPTVTLPALPDVHAVRDRLREHVEIMRTKKKVREIDFE